MTALFKKYVIGKDPTLCGASIVVQWADVEKAKGQFDFTSAEDLANHGRLDISILLPYSLANKIQVFELYPDEWLEDNGAKEWQPFEPAKQTKYKAALLSASQVLGQAAIR